MKARGLAGTTVLHVQLVPHEARRQLGQRALRQTFCWIAARCGSNREQWGEMRYDCERHIFNVFCEGLTENDNSWWLIVSLNDTLEFEGLVAYTLRLTRWTRLFRAASMVRDDGISRIRIRMCLTQRMRGYMLGRCVQWYK